MTATCSATVRPRHRRGSASVAPLVEAPPPSAIFKRRSTKLGLLALFALSFGLYATTCARTVTGEDSGELIAAAYTTGVAHPPGYPTWTMLAKLATWIPIGEVAFRVALMSAFFAALTVAALAAVVLLLTQAFLPAAAVSLAFGVLRDQWSQATIAEVYTLNTFFLATCTLLLLLWSETKSWRLFHLFAFTYGLSLTNHHLMLGAAPPFLLFMLIKGFRLLRQWPRILLGIACFLAGLLPYAYLPLAASRNPPINWGNPATAQGVIDHVARQQYLDTEVLPERTLERFGDQLAVLGEVFVHQGATALLVAGLMASLLLAWRRFPIFVLTFGVAASTSIGFILQTNVGVDFESAYASRLFHVPAWMMLLVAAGVSLSFVLRQLPRKVAVAARLVAVASCVAPPLAANFEEGDYSDYRVAAAHGRRLLMSVPGNAVLFPSSDHNTFPLLYLRFVEGLRPDVTIADKYGYIDPEIAQASPSAQGAHERTLRTRAFREAIEAWVIETWKRPVFFTSKGAAPAGYELVSEGLWYRVRRGRTPRGDARAADAAAWAAIEATPMAEAPSPCDYSARMMLSDTSFARARRLFGIGERDLAITEGQKAADLVPESKELQNNVGSMFAEHGAFPEADALLCRALAIDPAYATATRNLATSLRASGRLGEAKAQYLHLLDLVPLDPGANRALAEIARAGHNWGVAAHHLEQVGRVARDPVAFRDAGLITLVELNDPKRAKTLLAASLALDPNQPELREVADSIKDMRSKGEREKDAASARKDDPDDHKNHDCNARGCHARNAARGLIDTGAAAPPPPDPLQATLPKIPTAPQGAPPGASSPPGDRARRVPR